jgi:FtsH-binding integral membrane protein
MKPERTYEYRERRRRILRWIFLILALSLSCTGYFLLNVSPDTALDVAVSHVFWGIGLLVAGFVVAMVSRVVF